MRKPLNSPGVLAVCWLLILQIAVGSTVLSLPRAAYAAEGNEKDLVDRILEEGQADPEVAEGRAKIEAFADEIEKADTQNTYPKETIDAFRLTGQKLEVYGKETRVFDLSSLRVGLPALVPDFDKEVKVEINAEAKELALVYTKKGEVVAKHIITGVTPVAFARDVEMLQFVDAEGRMHVVDMVFARNTAFRAPLPVFEVGKLPEGALSKGKLHVAFGTRGVKPPKVIPNDAVLPKDQKLSEVWTAGDFIVTFDNAKGARELIGVYNRGVSQMQMYTGNAVLSFLATMVSPPEKEASMAEAVAPVAADPMVEARARKEAGKLDAPVRDALTAFNNDQVASLRARAFANKDLASSARDQYDYREWLRHFETLRDRAKGEYDGATLKDLEKDPSKYAELEENIKSENFSSSWQKTIEESLSPKQMKRSLFYRVMTHKAMKTLALFVGGYAVVSGVGVFVGMPITEQSARPLAWAVHAANWLYKNVWFDVLKDGAYRVTLLKSYLALGAFIPALQVVSGIYAKSKGGINSMMAKAMMGIRAYAEFQYPFWHRLAQITRQPNVMETFARGFNPFTLKVSKDSALGQKLGLEKNVMPGLVSYGSDRAREEQMKKDVLAALEAQKIRVRSYTHFLASIVVAEKFGIDPATLLMAKGGKLPGEDVSKTLNDPKFAKEWFEVAVELNKIMQDAQTGKLQADLTEISSQQLLEDFRAAKQLAAEIKRRTKLEAVVKKLGTRWSELATRFYGGFGKFGVEEYNFLKNVEPSKNVYEAAWQQFFADYTFTVIQIGLVGERAKPDLHPDMLAANEKGILYTNRQHFADMVDQAIRAYGLANPAELAMVFQKNSAPKETLYQPIEKITMVGKYHVDSFFNGMVKWTKGVMNLREANYQAVFFKSFKKKFKTLQSSLVLSMLARMGLAHQTFTQGMIGYGYLFFLGMPGFAWPWMPITQGNDTYTGAIEAANDALLAAKSKIAQGRRLNDPERMVEGMSELSAIYASHHDGELPKELEHALIETEKFLNVPEAERLSELAKLEKFYGEAAQIWEAREKGDAAELKATYERVRAQYGKELSSTMQALNASSLLEFALKHPPFANKAHPFVTWATTYFGSFVTTYLATSLFATSYGSDITPALFVKAMGVSATFYGGLWVGQKTVNKIGEFIDSRAYKTLLAEGKVAKTVIEVPETFAEYRKAYVASKAAEFGVDPSEVEAVIDSKLEEALKRRHESELTRNGCEQLLSVADAVKPFSFSKKLLMGAKSFLKK